MSLNSGTTNYATVQSQNISTAGQIHTTQVSYGGHSMDFNNGYGIQNPSDLLVGGIPLCTDGSSTNGEGYKGIKKTTSFDDLQDEYFPWYDDIEKFMDKLCEPDYVTVVCDYVVNYVDINLGDLGLSLGEFGLENLEGYGFDEICDGLNDEFSEYKGAINNLIESVAMSLFGEVCVFCEAWNAADGLVDFIENVVDSVEDIADGIEDILGDGGARGGHTCMIRVPSDRMEGIFFDDPCQLAEDMCRDADMRSFLNNFTFCYSAACQEQFGYDFDVFFATIMAGIGRTLTTNQMTGDVARPESINFTEFIGFEILLNLSKEDFAEYFEISSEFLENMTVEIQQSEGVTADTRYNVNVDTFFQDVLEY